MSLFYAKSLLIKPHHHSRIWWIPPGRHHHWFRNHGPPFAPTHRIVAGFSKAIKLWCKEDSSEVEGPLKALGVPSIFLESLEALNIEKSEESWLLPPESKQEQLLIDLLPMLGCFGILWILIWSCELHACQINSWAKVPFLCVAFCNNEILKDMQATMQKVVLSAKD